MAGVFLAWKLGLDGPTVKSAWKGFENFLAPRPWLLFGALVVLPALPIPTGLLLLLAGTVWREQPVAACLICLVALALNMSWTYWLAAGFGRRLIIRLLAWMGMKVPDLHEDNQLWIILLVRLTPGFPFFVQNYVLGLLRVPFRLYLGVSLACNGILSVGVVLGAAGLADRNWMPLVAGVAFLVAGSVLVQKIRGRMRPK
ncbi:VTT domain-containing protein [Luteolibacter sp. SL250]|uniref:TVP38/TMEM64 family protein n=1 Tax=Luteolibacter sp. SL250 TaxID=2995170 RepID=UPI0022700A13|nr:VTT domain-containing protein [Luteolibacter sp. SL250]WAC19643.1 VTT domain-containing protein [Luteolibacter sp. SL250]